MGETFLHEAVTVLERTPAGLDALLRDMPEAWIRAADGEGTWSAYDVVGHLIHGERTDWMPRLGIMLEHGTGRPFERFDREAQSRLRQDRPVNEMLDEFRDLRAGNLEKLRGMGLTGERLESKGLHPDLGEVTVRQLLATWVAHDLDHLVQISRTMARRYRAEVGPWAQYLGVMR